MAETDFATSTGSRSTGKRTAQRKKSVEKTRTDEGSRKANGRTGLLALLEEDPWRVGAATLALGFVAGLVLPSTRKENELMGEQRERLLARANEVGQEALDKGQQMVVQAVASAREGVQEAAASGAAQGDRKTAGKRSRSRAGSAGVG